MPSDAGARKAAGKLTSALMAHVAKTEGDQHEARVLRPAGAGSSGTRCHWYMLTVYGKQELVRAAKEYTAADLAGQSGQHWSRVVYEKKRKQDALVEEGFERCQHCHTPLVGGMRGHQW